jgi:hypothetical protein
MKVGQWKVRNYFIAAALRISGLPRDVATQRLLSRFHNFLGLLSSLKEVKPKQALLEMLACFLSWLATKCWEQSARKQTLQNARRYHVEICLLDVYYTAVLAFPICNFLHCLKDTLSIHLSLKDLNFFAKNFGKHLKKSCSICF